jgi:hypothetical protein
MLQTSLKSMWISVLTFTYKLQKYMENGDTSIPWYRHTQIQAEGVICIEIFIF